MKENQFLVILILDVFCFSFRSITHLFPFYSVLQNTDPSHINGLLWPIMCFVNRKIHQELRGRQESESEVVIPPVPSFSLEIAYLNQGGLLHITLFFQVPVTIPSPHSFKPNSGKSFDVTSSGVLCYPCDSFIYAIRTFLKSSFLKLSLKTTR